MTNPYDKCESQFGPHCGKKFSDTPKAYLVKVYNNASMKQETFWTEERLNELADYLRKPRLYKSNSFVLTFGRYQGIDVKLVPYSYLVYLAGDGSKKLSQHEKSRVAALLSVFRASERMTK